MKDKQEFNEAHLLWLGVLSFVLGPVTAVPGVYLAARMPPSTPVGKVGRFLCWLSLIVLVWVILLTAAMWFALGTKKANERGSLPPRHSQIVQPSAQLRAE